MKKTNPVFYCVLALLFFAIGACTPKDSFEETVLKLSETQLTFEKGVSEKVIEVTTNAESWIVSSPKEKEWLTIRREGKSLHISVAENKSGIERSTYINVIANGAAGKIEVVQHAADIVLSVSPGEIIIDAAGGERTVEVDTNAESWKLEDVSGIKWLTISSKPQRGLIVITISENKSEDDRIAKIYASSGKEQKEIIIRQRGIKLFHLPYMDESPSANGLFDYERLQGHTLIKTPDGFFNTNKYVYITNAKYIQQISYEIPGDSYIYNSAKLLSVYPDVIASDKYKAFLAAQGFVYKRESVDKSGVLSRIYECERENFIYFINCVIDKKKGAAEINMTASPKQKKEYPTFSAFPYRKSLEFLSNPQIKAQQIIDWETTEGGSVLVEKSDEGLMFRGEKDKTRAYTGWVFILEGPDNLIGSASQVSDYYTTYEKVYWIANNGARVITKEFAQLLAKEGFVYHRQIVLEDGGKIDIYYNKTNDMLLGLSLNEEKASPSGYMLGLTFAYQDKKTGSAGQVSQKTLDGIKESVIKARKMRTRR